MPDFQYQPPTGPLSGSEFERQTTRFFQQVQGAADAAQSTAIVAQTTANEALERAQASKLVDGKTTQADAGGVITVKDVAIGGNLADLASKRGQIGDYVGRGSFDFNSEILDTKNVFFGHTGSTNMPFPGSSAVQVKSRGYADYKWIAYLAQNCGYIASPRAAIKSSYTEDGGASFNTAGWSKLLDEKHVGDGLTVNNGIISVPEYEGATASAAGTSGLVPPAAAGQANYVLCGDGQWRDIATLVAAAQARIADKAAS